MAMTEIVLVVADAGPLIHLDELDALDVLSHYSAIFIPDAVWKEVEYHRSNALQKTDIKFIRKAQLPISEKIDAISSLYTLHQGEREVLNLCLNLSITTLLSDDTAARLAAKNLNITTHGTLGLLIRAIRLQLRTRDEVLALLKTIPNRTTLHIRPSLLSEIIEQVKFDLH